MERTLAAVVWQWRRRDEAFADAVVHYLVLCADDSWNIDC
jgi:hypothetical protein